MRLVYFLYGVVCYVLFLGTFLYAIGFVGNFAVPKSMDTGPVGPLGEAILVNLVLLGIFAVQHSVMARRSFKQWWTRIIPPVLERSTFVLMSSLALMLLFWQWRPMGHVLWDVSGTFAGHFLVGVSFFGWFVVLLSTFLIDHFELFGVKQVYLHLAGRQASPRKFITPALYRYVRHPIYLGFTVAFWATPVMTTAHLLFAVATFGYVLIGIFLEEKDLVAAFGHEYQAYRERVAMLFPRLPRK